jgi:predicted metal-binding protein
MLKIAMLNCDKANEVCTGASCMTAFNKKSASFARYDGQQISLEAFLRCNGCAAGWKEDKGMREKLERLTQIGIDAVHLGVCTKDHAGVECQNISEIASFLESQGISIVRGTH